MNGVIFTVSKLGVFFFLERSIGNNVTNLHFKILKLNLLEHEFWHIRKSRNRSNFKNFEHKQNYYNNSNL